MLCHCSDGWDRTSQLVSLAELCLDPYFRTIEVRVLIITIFNSIQGFIALIEKEFIYFGHQFGIRIGIGDEGYSQVFLQWLDCVYQLLHQNPKGFEFNAKLLLFIANNIETHLYGTFLYNNELV